VAENENCYGDNKNFALCTSEDEKHQMRNFRINRMFSIERKCERHIMEDEKRGNERQHTHTHIYVITQSMMNVVKSLIDRMNESIANLHLKQIAQ
jgi:hypothetical protein